MLLFLNYDNARLKTINSKHQIYLKQTKIIHKIVNLIFCTLCLFCTVSSINTFTLFILFLMALFRHLLECDGKCVAIYLFHV